MNLLKGIVFSLLRFISVNTLDVVSEEKDVASQRSNDHVQHRPIGIERRFNEDLNDKEWHIAHLKDENFDIKNDCEEETLTDKVNKYRKTLKEDGSLVEYVSADALPINENDLHIKKCVSTSKFVDENLKVNFSKSNDTDSAVDLILKDKLVTKEIDAATTASLKNTGNNIQNATEDKARRASEYQFSSVEYYDEVDDFHDNTCPDSVEVIHLEIDTLRNYDVECESMVEWRSLE